MAVEQAKGIVPGEESTIHDEPHVEGSRITVRYIQKRVEERGLRPETVADRHNLALAGVYAALSYFHNNPEEMRAVEARYERLAEEAERRSTLEPPGE